MFHAAFHKFYQSRIDGLDRDDHGKISLLREIIDFQLSVKE